MWLVLKETRVRDQKKPSVNQWNKKKTIIIIIIIIIVQTMP